MKLTIRQTPLFFFLSYLASCTLLFATHFFTNSFYNSTLLFFSYLKTNTIAATTQSNLPLSNTTIRCDRTDYHSDICFMAGDVRTHSSSSSIILYPPPSNPSNWVIKEERIRLYTRKWETPLMKTIDEILPRTAVDLRRLRDHKSIMNFQKFLRKSYEPNNKLIVMDAYSKKKNHAPKLVIVSRKGTREIENERDVVQVGQKVGFVVEVARPNRTMPLKHIFDTLSTCDVAMGVRGAALTHFLFMRPGSILIQIEPRGIEHEAWKCFGEPVLKMGMRYVNYKVELRESSLYGKYPIPTDPNAMMIKKKKGWKRIKELYLKWQTVTLDLNKVKKVLAQAIRVLG